MKTQQPSISPVLVRVDPCWLALVLPVLILALPSCGRKNPVDVVSADGSGVLVVDAAYAPSSSDWASWRGPSGDGIAPAQEVVDTWSETTNVLWRSDVPGRGHSSPIVVKDSVFLATADDAREEQLVIAYRRSDGEEIWRTTIHKGNFPSKGEVHHKATNANGTIASDGERLFIAMLNSDAIMATSLDLNGDILWQREVGKFVSRFSYAPSPVLYKSLVIFAADNSGGGYLAALDCETGEVAWRVARGNVDSYSSAMVANVGGRDQLLISGCDAVTSYDPANGEELWKTECISDATCGTIVTTPDLIFASGGYPDKETVCLTSSGERRWATQDKIYEPSMIISGDQLVGVTDDGIAQSWDLETGDRRWKKRLGGNFSASPVLVGDQIIVSNLKGETFVFRAGDRLDLVATNRLGDDCHASPAVADGKLFLRIGIGEESNRKEQLVCIGVESESESESE